MGSGSKFSYLHSATRPTVKWFFFWMELVVCHAFEVVEFFRKILIVLYLTAGSAEKNIWTLKSLLMLLQRNFNQSCYQQQNQSCNEFFSPWPFSRQDSICPVFFFCINSYLVGNCEIATLDLVFCASLAFSYMVGMAAQNEYSKLCACEAFLVDMVGNWKVTSLIEDYFISAKISSC